MNNIYKILPLIIFGVSFCFSTPTTTFAKVFTPINTDYISSRNLIDEMSSQFDSKILNATTSVGKILLYSQKATSTGTWIRNTSVWSATGTTPFDFTGRSPWNSSWGYGGAGTMISPRHIVFANHYSVSNGATIAFIDANNNIIIRTLSNQLRVGSTDIKIGILDSDLPASIAYYPIISDELYKTYLNSESHIPMVIVDLNNNVLIHDSKTIVGVGSIYVMPPVATTSRNVFFSDIDNGDSGSPVFLAINGQLVLSSTLTHGPASELSCDGPSYGYNISAINTVMTSLGGGYQVSTYDLSYFNVHGQPVINTQSLNVYERSATGTSIGNVSGTVTPSDLPKIFSITSGNDGNLFSIATSTGDITLNKGNYLNSQNQSVYNLDVKLSDGRTIDAGFGGSTTTTVSINVLSATTTLSFSTSSYTFSLDDLAATSTLVGSVVAATTLPDTSISYSITAGDNSNIFDVSTTTGEITLAKPALINYESTSTYNLTVTATDNWPTSNSKTVPVVINVSTTSRPIISFSAASQSVSETGGSVFLVVNLSQASTRTVTANFSSIDISAIAGQDYTATSGVLTFLPGATTTTFSVLVNQDSINEGDEAFTVVLSSSTYSLLGSTSSIIVTIVNYTAPIVSSGGGGGGGWSALFVAPVVATSSLAKATTSALIVSTTTNILVSSSSTSSELNKILSSLSPEVKKLLESLGVKFPVVADVNTKPKSIISSFNKNYSFGQSCADIKRLQVFLNTHGYKISNSGVGSPGKETNYFGPATVKALKKLQGDNGLPTTGYFGPQTRALISSL